jgi:excisionase family DNA binding protein
MSERLTIGLAEASETLGISHWTLRRYIREGKIRAVRIGRRVLVEPVELGKLVNNGAGLGRQAGMTPAETERPHHGLGNASNRHSGG